MRVKPSGCVRPGVWLLAALGFMPAPAWCQTYPARPIRIIDGFPAGGGTDFLARVIGQKLTERLGQSVIVDNRAGAAGNIGAEVAAKSPPDGYTLFIGLSSTLAPSPSLYSRLGYDVLRDFAPVTLVASGLYVLVVHPSLPAISLKALIALAKARPGQINYGSSGVGAPLHLAAEMLKARAGIDLVHVPYKGAAPVIAAVTAGEVSMGFASLAAALPMVKVGKLRALAVTSAGRSAAVPELPTVAESGFPGFDITPWYGILAPAATPREIVSLLNAEIGRIVRLPDVRKAFATQGLEAVSSTPEQLAAVLKAEIAQWAKVIRDANIRAD